MSVLIGERCSQSPLRNVGEIRQKLPVIVALSLFQ
jgi:hypothetical protein